MARTAQLPGTEEPRHDELNALALEYVVVRDARMTQLKKEVELKGRLLAMMGLLELTYYHDDDLTITLETKTKVKVKVGTEEEDAE